MDCSTPVFAVLHYLLEFAQTHVHHVCDTIQPSHPALPLLLPPSIFPSIRFYSNESVPRIKWPKYWSFSFSISPSNEYSELISFKIEWSCCFVLLGYWYMTSRVILHLWELWPSWGAWQSLLHELNLSSFALHWNPRSQVDNKEQQSQTDKYNYNKNH